MTPVPSKYQYFRGYPSRYRLALFSRIGCTIGCLPLLAVPLFCVSFYWKCLHGHLRPGPIVALVLSGLYFLLFVALLANGFPTPQILPYFEKRLGNAGTWLHGQALARNCRALDEAAAADGATPLSEFGYGDELNGEPFTWHDAGRGIETVRKLEELLSRFPGLVDDLVSVRGELQFLEDALAKADARGVRFCLHMRCSDYTSGIEMEARKGSYF